MWMILFWALQMARAHVTLSTLFGVRSGLPFHDGHEALEPTWRQLQHVSSNLCTLNGNDAAVSCLWAVLFVSLLAAERAPLWALFRGAPWCVFYLALCTTPDFFPLRTFFCD